MLLVVTMKPELLASSDPEAAKKERAAVDLRLHHLIGETPMSVDGNVYTFSMPHLKPEAHWVEKIKQSLGEDATVAVEEPPKPEAKAK